VRGRVRAAAAWAAGGMAILFASLSAGLAMFFTGKMPVPPAPAWEKGHEFPRAVNACD